MSALGLLKFESNFSNLSKKSSKKDFFDEEIPEFRNASLQPNTQIPSRNEGLRKRSPVNNKRKLILLKDKNPFYKNLFYTFSYPYVCNSFNIGLLYNSSRYGKDWLFRNLSGKN